MPKDTKSMKDFKAWAYLTVIFVVLLIFLMIINSYDATTLNFPFFIIILVGYCICSIVVVNNCRS